MLMILVMVVTAIDRSRATDYEDKGLAGDMASGDIIVRQVPGNNSMCEAYFQRKMFKCSLGKNGVVDSSKVEGDGKTPIGRYPFRQVFYRSDRVDKPVTILNTMSLAITDGWCDEPSDANYNRYVSLPYPSSHEDLYRDDDLYDIITVIGYNDDPVVTSKGSAIFMHITKDYGSTAGCIAFHLADLEFILAHVTEDSHIAIS